MSSATSSLIMEGDMKKSALVLVFLACALLPLGAASFGWSYTMEGWSGYNEASSSRASAAIDLTPARYLVIEAGAGVGFHSGRMVFTGLTADLSFSTFRLYEHPFGFMFTNPVVWSPRISAGVVWDRDWDLAWRFGLSLFDFQDVHFSYSFLRPFVNFDLDFDYVGWGIDLFRVTYFL